MKLKEGGTAERRKRRKGKKGRKGEKGEGVIGGNERKDSRRRREGGREE